MSNAVHKRSALSRSNNQDNDSNKKRQRRRGALEDVTNRSTRSSRQTKSEAASSRPMTRAAARRTGEQSNTDNFSDDIMFDDAVAAELVDEAVNGRCVRRDSNGSEAPTRESDAGARGAQQAARRGFIAVQRKKSTSSASVMEVDSATDAEAAAASNDEDIGDELLDSEDSDDVAHHLALSQRLQEEEAAAAAMMAANDASSNSAALGGVKLSAVVPDTPVLLGPTLSSGQERGLRWSNVDNGYEHRPEYCTEIVHEIFAYLRHLERCYHADPDYVENVQEACNASMRHTLVDWLVEVAEEYRLNSETLFLTINLVDRYLSRKSVKKSRLQLVGVAACLIASKYEEIYPPRTDDFVYISDNTYTRQEIFEMESDMLQTLDYRLAAATSKAFCRRFIKATKPVWFPSEYSGLLPSLATYIAELSLTDYSMLKYYPSEISACSVALALDTYNLECWPDNLTYYTKYWPDAGRIRQCLTDLHRLVRSRTPQSTCSVYRKYASYVYMHVAQSEWKERPPRPVIELD